MNMEYSKHKIVFNLFDSFAVFLGYWTTYLFSKNSGILFTFVFSILLILITTIFDFFTEDYRYINSRGYLKEIRYAILYSIDIVVSFIFLLLIIKSDIYIYIYQILKNLILL